MQALVQRRISRSTLLVLATVLVVTSFSISSFAQSPVNASVTVRIVGEKTAFRIGEEIPLELEFRGKGDPTYYFSTESYDRSGRMTTETYSATPAAGFTDPLADLYLDGVVGGGLRSEHPLNDTPFKLRVSLNDWIRFTSPGVYRVTVNSSRLHQRPFQPGPTLTSSPLEITILPSDSIFLEAQVKTGLELLGSPKREDVQRGAALLRYADTEQGARSLVERFDSLAKTNGWEVILALTASSHRKLIVGLMEGRLDDGGELDANFIGALARLRAFLDVPPVPGNVPARSLRFRTLQTEYDARWRAALARRPATPGTLGAQMARLLNGSPEMQDQIARDLDVHPVEAAEAFIGLPTDVQRALLDSRWALVNRPWIVPALRRVVQSTGEDIWGARGFATKRLYEVAPDEGRQFILNEIRTGRSKIPVDALAILPEPSLPELDTTLQRRYESPEGDRGSVASLIARYGSANLLPFVAKAVGQPMDCASETGLLGYLLKYDPSAALTRLGPDFNRARGCVSVFLGVANRFWEDRLEPVAFAHLRSANDRFVVEAAQVLGKHGSIAAKERLLERLAKWSSEWQGRAAELAAIGLGGSYSAAIENNVVNALLENPAFLLTPDELTRIRSLCVSVSCRNALDSRIQK
jgi:hypothetical protein